MHVFFVYAFQVCYVIDVGQAVDTGHPKARELLSRDLSVVTDFFRRQGVKGCLDSAVAEHFVVGYRGPSNHGKDGCDASAAKAKMTATTVTCEGEQEPATGVDVIAEVSAFW